MKVTFVTFHNWITKRIGGFHKLAEATSKAGHEVVFLSFARPYYIMLKHEERLNANVLKELSNGVIYEIDNLGNKITNCTWPTLRIPQPLYRFLPSSINHFFQTHSLESFKKFQNKFLEGTEIFVFESCEGIELIDLIKKYNPKSKITYRPSDPIMLDNANKENIRMEEKIMLQADMNYIVNLSGLELYRRKITNFDRRVKFTMLPNGVDTSLFALTYDCPDVLKKKNTFLYVGARVIEWDLIIKAAKERPEYNFVIVCPENPPKNFEKNASNLIYIPGISPKDVPAWITNASVIIVPNPKGWYKIKPWGITAKYYQAMEAKKPIVVFEDTDELCQYGVYVSHDYTSFINYLDKAIQGSSKFKYAFPRADWDTICQKFINSISCL